MRDKTITESKLSCRVRSIGGDFTQPIGDTIYLQGNPWREIGRHVMEVLQEHPDRTYETLDIMVRNEGGRIDDLGFIR